MWAWAPGTCTDFYGNAELTAKVEAAWKAGKVVGADCHGPIGLLGCKKEDGTPLIAGKKVTGFSNSEEGAVGNELDSGWVHAWVAGGSVAMCLSFDQTRCI